MEYITLRMCCRFPPSYYLYPWRFRPLTGKMANCIQSWRDVCITPTENPLRGQTNKYTQWLFVVCLFVADRCRALLNSPCKITNHCWPTQISVWPTKAFSVCAFVITICFKWHRNVLQQVDTRFYFRIQLRTETKNNTD